ncbi:Pr6Pr family membrane protein [Rhizorhabdus dicambivorans]|uniref:F420-dependent oxidoreductase n=1 Tax=Rhizorhabdus dicambivorans TaxID=1850238 RepID=A0A2A4FTG4_9SPHN|nr:Pr6Pr family membrane protein [Rhizorhabdus dicambivorans]ATE67101.1 hypothetical protein CMV14_02980 [Rhizorhabdus dicambivorans]PCE41477.1 hypothetical protein COO09_15405 [Rhizorhabdus dicambivorans]
MSIVRLAHALVALSALAGIALHYAILLTRDVDMLYYSIRFLSYFTIQTNALVAAAAIGVALGRGRLHRWATRPAVRTAISLHILVVAIVFHLLLGHMVPPGALGWWGNLLLHTVTPAAWLACWIAFPPHGGIDPVAPLRWIVFPLIFAGWSLARGAIDGFYPYFFLDAGQFGYARTLANIAALGFLFFAVGHALRAIDLRLART